MRKDYELRLDELAQSKRKALRDMNDMFESRIEEKDIILTEVSKRVLTHQSTAVNIYRYSGFANA